MAKLKTIALGVAILGSTVGYTMAANAAGDDVCYDRAVVGHIRHAEHFAGLDQFVEVKPNEVILGGRWDVDIDVEKVVAGALTPTPLKARVVLTTLFTRNARLLIFLKDGPLEPDKDNTLQEWNGRLVPRASADHPWRVVLVTKLPNRIDLGEPSFPPRCS